MVKSKIASLVVQEFTTLADVQAAHVVVVHTLIVAASPLSHLSPFNHSGITKSNIAAPEVPELVTLALVHGFHVVVLHTVIVAASQVFPLSPLSHFCHSGITKSNTAALLVQLLVTLAAVQGCQVVVVQAVIVAAVQVSPLSPLSPLSPFSPLRSAEDVPLADETVKAVPFQE